MHVHNPREVLGKFFLVMVVSIVQRANDGHRPGQGVLHRHWRQILRFPPLADDIQGPPPSNLATDCGEMCDVSAVTARRFCEIFEIYALDEAAKVVDVILPAHLPICQHIDATLVLGQNHLLRRAQDVDLEFFFFLIGLLSKDLCVASRCIARVRAGAGLEPIRDFEVCRLWKGADDRRLDWHRAARGNNHTGMRPAVLRYATGSHLVSCV
mmetsp:Transcript_148059/g.369104  ORF Transcript_148059/g.369104 Transcript_148059/m.369104 type:complete len:211 (-) Transcript_148059:11-643(-)